MPEKLIAELAAFAKFIVEAGRVPGDFGINADARNERLKEASCDRICREKDVGRSLTGRSLPQCSTMFGRMIQL